MSVLPSSQFQASQLFDVNGWVAVVTGGGTGLGLVAAVTLLANGAARVYITGRREDVLQNAASTYGGISGEIIPVVCDATKKEDIERLVTFVRSKEKFVNLLVNNASVGGIKNDFKNKKSIEEISEALFAIKLQTWSEVLHLNTSSMFFTSAAFLPLLVSAKDHFPAPGSILNISSMSGITKQSQGGQFAYNAAKAGTISLTKQLAYEFSKPEIGVRVNALAPGYFPSEMTPALTLSSPAEFRARTGVPAGRQGRPTEYAQAVLNMAVNEYINGTILVIDGGWLLEQS